jgi:hypothetical protein
MGTSFSIPFWQNHQDPVARQTLRGVFDIKILMSTVYVLRKFLDDFGLGLERI